ncbi:hypothetical protein N9H39_06605 [Gammaproteobacteria bacterium]|nr:hypothetical protein [Gammaproteobacteria bacterium]
MLINTSAEIYLFTVAESSSSSALSEGLEGAKPGPQNNFSDRPLQKNILISRKGGTQTELLIFRVILNSDIYPCEKIGSTRPKAIIVRCYATIQIA